MNAELAQMIDHTLLKPEASDTQIEKLCEEAKAYHFASVCINPCYVRKAKNLLLNSDVLVCTVVGFPLGANTSETKAHETMNAIENGADEIDMVINIGAVKNGQWEMVKNDICAVVLAAAGKTVKVILETCLLTKEEIQKSCEQAIEAHAHFVKTSTGFSSAGAQIQDVKLMKSIVKDHAKIKASGGIRDRETAMAFKEAGAERIGTSSGIQIVSS